MITATFDSLLQRRARVWLMQGSTAMCEQACYAGSHFLLNVILALSMPAELYGAFAFAAAASLIATGVYSALILEPAAVLRVEEYEQAPARYCWAQVTLHPMVAGILGIGLVLAGGGILAGGGSRILGSAFVAAGIACPFSLLLLLARRFLYVLRRPGAALAGSAGYLIAVCGAALLLRQHGRLSPAVAFLILGIGSAGAALFMLTAAGVFRSFRSERRFSAAALLSERWRYGRWLLGVVAIEIAFVPALTFMTSTLLGFAALGTLRAMQSFVLPLNHGIVAVSGLTLPIVARDFGRGQIETLIKRSAAIRRGLVAAAFGVLSALVLFHAPLVALVYQGKFAEHSSLIPILGLAAVFDALAVSYATVLSAVRRPWLLLLNSAIAAPVGLGAGLVCMSQWGLSGAALAFVAGAAVKAVSGRWLCNRFVSSLYRDDG